MLVYGLCVFAPVFMILYKVVSEVLQFSFRVFVCFQYTCIVVIILFG